MTREERIAKVKEYRHRPENRERVLKQARVARRAYYKRIRSEIFDILGHQCLKCGFKDWRALQVDHINGGGKKDYHRYARTTVGESYYKHILNDLIGGSNEYQTLCANCNSIKRHENKEWNPEKDVSL